MTALFGELSPMSSESSKPYFALIDCNNFFASCEQLLNPRLVGKPVVILSSNDGCIIARSREAKALGIQMGTPAFQNRALFAEKGVYVLSSNFTLYGDLSERVMTTLETFGYPIEVYSIDEAFIHLPALPKEELEELGKAIRHRIGTWIGLPIAVGIASTKTLAKAANQIAKKKSGVFCIATVEEMKTTLMHTPVGEVWGIGKHLTAALHSYGMRTVSELIHCDDLFIRKKFSVTLLRTVWELRGISCLEEKDDEELSKSFICSRSFGRKVLLLSELKEAVASYVAKGATRLRTQGGAARCLQVFVCTDHLHSQSASIELLSATAYTPELIYYAHSLLTSLFKEGTSYKKAGIVLSEIVSQGSIQPDLLHNVDLKKRETIMNTIDAINREYSRKTLRFAAEGMTQAWSARSEKRSPRYTTSWNELPIVK